MNISNTFNESKHIKYVRNMFKNTKTFIGHVWKMQGNKSFKKVIKSESSISYPSYIKCTSGNR